MKLINNHVVTLFEGNYHYGVAGLCNSLHKQGFNGDVFVGYRGELPDWTLKAENNKEIGWDNAKSLKVSGSMTLHFLPLTTKYSLTNYKPDFLIELFENKNLNIDSLFYLDPDITINKHWDHFMQWIDAGVALCEDVNSPIPEHHPRRVGWKNYYTKFNLDLNFKTEMYINGGFIGLKRDDIQFLKTWKLAQEYMGEKIGGLERSIFSKGPVKLEQVQGFNIFDKTDQDALNIAIETSLLKVSIIGKEAMAFNVGYNIMYHNLGNPKPWNNNYSKEFFAGNKPSLGDYHFWRCANSETLRPYAKQTIMWKLFWIKVYRFLSRFYGAKK
ncbi:hypothetical protein [Winogradskyella ludwigii]|uniref:hypothetical protein n=1 Tax=Winogradskyella ludwigii TaxID=2686076 RepID=UPI0015C95EE2|nr:hypothetical protein [Winogradskyella ludwigii]